MKDLNSALTAIFDIVRDEDGDLVARSPQFEDMDFHVIDDSIEGIRACITPALGMLYPLMFDCPTPATIFLSEDTNPQSGALRTYSARIVAPR